MTDSAIITLEQIKAIEERKTAYMGLLRELVVNGKKLNDQQIVGRAAFAAMQGLDPVTEVHTLVDNSGNTMAHTMAINGYRRKCAEQVEAKIPGGTVDLEFAEIEKAKLPPNSFVGFECRLRDSVSYQDWQKRILDVGKTLKEVLGSLDYKVLIEACGPAPIYTGVGIVYQDELSAWKDKNFNPIERAKKRAELNARKRRFPTNAPIQENEGLAPVVSEAVEGVIVESKSETTETEKRSEAQIMTDLYGPDKPAQPGTYTREDAAKDTEKPSEQPSTQETPTAEKSSLRYEPDMLKARIAEIAATQNGQVSNGKKGLVATCLEAIYSISPDPEACRKQAMHWLTGYDSLKSMPDNFVLALYKWLDPSQDSGGAWQAAPMSQREALAVLNAAQPAQARLL